MQCAAMSEPQSRSRPRGRATIGFVPIESVEAARAGRLDCGAKPLDDRARRLQRDSRCLVPAHRPSLERGPASRLDCVQHAPSLLTSWTFEPLQLIPVVVAGLL